MVAVLWGTNRHEPCPVVYAWSLVLGVRKGLSRLESFQRNENQIAAAPREAAAGAHEF